MGKTALFETHKRENAGGGACCTILAARFESLDVLRPFSEPDALLSPEQNRRRVAASPLDAQRTMLRRNAQRLCAAVQAYLGRWDR